MGGRVRTLILVVALVAVGVFAGSALSQWWEVPGSEAAVEAVRAVVRPRERVRVEVLNAGGRPNMARDATETLRDGGFDVVVLRKRGLVRQRFVGGAGPGGPDRLGPCRGRRARHSERAERAGPEPLLGCFRCARRGLGPGLAHRSRSPERAARVVGRAALPSTGGGRDGASGRTSGNNGRPGSAGRTIGWRRSNESESAVYGKGGVKTEPKAPARPPGAGSLWEGVKSLVLALVLFLFLRSFVIQNFVITSGSMEETLLVGDFLMVNRVALGSRISLHDREHPRVFRAAPVRRNRLRSVAR